MIKKNTQNPKDLIGATKPAISLVPPSVMIYLAEAFKNGASKYGPYNWRQNKVVGSIYLDATFRHLLAYIDGEDCAEDSKLEHLAHAVASLAVLIDAKETGNLVDDRPKKGAASKLILKFTKTSK